MSQPAQNQDPPGTEQQMHPAPDHGETSYRGSGRLKGKAAVVTGADSGIGKAVAIAFAREGADVVISYLNEHDDAEDTRKWVQDAGRKAVLVPGDLTDPAHCRTVIDRAVEELGRVDVLVSNAAFPSPAEIPSCNPAIPDNGLPGSPRYPGSGQDHRPDQVGRAGERRGPPARSDGWQAVNQPSYPRRPAGPIGRHAAVPANDGPRWT